MKKSNKILLIIGLILFAIIMTALVICYCFWKIETIRYVYMAWEWLNEPLPLVGVSLLVIGFFIVKIIANSSIGKRYLNTFVERTDDVEKAFKEAEEKINKLEDYVHKLEEHIHQLEEANRNICKAIPNKKVKMLGEEYYGKERTNDETKAE